MLRINISQINSIEAIIKQQHKFIEYKPFKKKFFGNQKAGFYDWLHDRYIEINEILESGDYYIEDNKIYYYPHLEIRMGDKSRHFKYFKDVDQLNKFILSKKLKINKWILI